MIGNHGPDHGRMQQQVERAHGRAAPNARAPFWLIVVGLVAVAGLVAFVVIASLLGA